ncbi:methyltransferase domain-containing protein [Rubrobacter tropicus]|uniref:Methyltransferase domain-containing protein n=1 Tax=Rubrobacter tropicus TaxID=2653851 RepID=A0A6G8Q5P9_9ACTN|nr:class I SAM-dependent methyltransferase [Rubrobacter tropicus]QIN81773.1 methyltransferase domain-containing protein [Rubrobacter tropicus]
MVDWYREDLAYIHDVGHADFALKSAPGILEILKDNGIPDGLVVDLGCGSGLWARELLGAGYRVHGIDISEAMIELAWQKAPGAEFRVGSLFEAEIPPCDAVTAVSEVLNYLFDPAYEERGLRDLFGRVHGALRPGGVFVFDVLGPGQVPAGVKKQGFSKGPDWAVLNEKEEDEETGTMERRIVSFRRVGDLYRRTDEVHRVRLYGPQETAAALGRAGFEVRTMGSYGGYPLGENHAAFVARKT